MIAPTKHGGGRMRAITVSPEGALRWEEVEAPRPGPGQLRVRVQATAVNRADLLQRKGLYPPPPGESAILGLEAAGEIDAVGEGVTGWAIGDRVTALLAGGGYAEQVVVPAGQVLPWPRGYDAIRAAAVPEAFATAWLNLFQEGGLRPAERLLVHAGASGVGTAAIQLARSAGCPTWVTVGSADKLDVCVELGAEGGVNRHEARFADAVDDWTEGRGLDLILDCVGGAYLEDNLRSLAVDGRLVVIGLLGGRAANLDLGRLLVKRLRVIGSTLRSRSVFQKSELMRRLGVEVWPQLSAGVVAPIIDQVMPITEAEAAHARVATDATIGKVVLTVP